MIAAAGALMWMFFPSSDEAPVTVDYSVFYDWVENEKLESVVIRDQVLEGELKAKEQVDEKSITKFRTTLPVGDDELVPTLRSKNVRIKVATEEKAWAGQLIAALLPWLLIIGIWIFLSRRASNMMGGGGPISKFMKTKSRRIEKSAVTVSFDDVAGLKNAKRDLQEVVQFLKEPEQFRRLGAKVPRGVLLVGPPGTGKTLLARAVAGESDVPFYRISASEFIEMFVGVGAARVRELFEEAKKDAPSIVFIDEIDAVGRSRGAGLGGGHDEREQTLNQLLSEMDGFDQHDEVIVLAATNRPDVLDPALLRPGRFDRRVFVDRPELAAREAILAVHCRDKPISEDVDLKALAANTPGFSGADLANLVNEAALNATRGEADTIGPADFSSAFDKIVLGDPSETKLTGDERRRVAIHEAGHATVGRYSREAEALHRVSIIPRGIALGVTQQTPAADRHLMTQTQLESKLRTLMGGYAAERLVLGDISTGAENDLKQATELASNMVAHYGMSEAIGPVYVDHGEEHPFLGHKIATESGASDATLFAVETELRSLLSLALDEATKLLVRHRKKLDKLVEELLAHETLEAEELSAILTSSPQTVDEPRVA
jgi:cell division protease FtsH